ncbi:Serine/threonine-protein kinase [Marasmius tenuissimus]|nr:Serine/threonine-protein kinase [Marasmius tenuissimus]
MGNVQSGSTLTRTTGALDSFISELGGDIVYERSLGTARFLKTVRCRHKNGLLVVKIFIKPDPGVTLRTHLRRLKVEREALSDIANVYNYQTFVETDKAGYIIRQWIASNLYDRISTRPFLSPIEKKWIAFRLSPDFAMHATARYLMATSSLRISSLPPGIGSISPISLHTSRSIFHLTTHPTFLSTSTHPEEEHVILHLNDSILPQATRRSLLKSQK